MFFGGGLEGERVCGGDNTLFMFDCCVFNFIAWKNRSTPFCQTGSYVVVESLRHSTIDTLTCYAK